MPLGRFTSRYDRLRRIGQNETDLAVATFGKAKVSCWTCPDNRHWGTHGPDQRRAAVMRFNIEADPGPLEGILSYFELDLQFAEATIASQSSEQALSVDTSGMEEACASVSLIGAPAPRSVAHSARTWSFWSIRLSDDDSGEAVAARWGWHSDSCHELRGRVLHGGVAFYHPGEPFRIDCHVRGRVSKPNGIILKFSNRHHQPRSWILAPLECQEDLQHHIEQLHRQTENLNVPTSSQGMSARCLQAVGITDDNTVPAAPEVDAVATRGSFPASTYGPATISDRAFVHMGDNYYGYGYNAPVAQH